jgi:hypothetical protein
MRRGTPKTQLTAGVFVRLPEQTANRLRFIAVAEKRTLSAQMRILIEEALSARGDRNQGAA